MRGVFDIVGPVMIGPSSSHTAGAARLGLMAGKILGERVVKVEILLHGSFFGIILSGIYEVRFMRL